MPGVLKAHIPAKSPLIPYLRAAPSAAAAAAATGSAAAGEGGPWGGRRTLLFFHGALCWKIYDKVDGMAAMARAASGADRRAPTAARRRVASRRRRAPYRIIAHSAPSLVAGRAVGDLYRDARASWAVRVSAARAAARRRRRLARRRREIFADFAAVLGNSE